MGECFEAVSSDLSFMPLPNCFELFGFDFLVDEAWGVWLLEANAEPDFVQTGSRLSGVIREMIGGVCDVAVVPLATTGEEGRSHEATKTTTRRQKWRKVFEKRLAGSEGMGFQVC